MNEVIEKDDIRNMIYKIRGVQAMLNCELSVTECNNYVYDKIITNYNIILPILVFKKFIMGGGK